MERTIGNSGCQCVFPYEKHYMKLGIDKLIEKENEQIKKVKETAEEIRKIGLIEPEALIGIHERFKMDVETVKKRLEKTPDCTRSY